MSTPYSGDEPQLGGQTTPQDEPRLGGEACVFDGADADDQDSVVQDSVVQETGVEATGTDRAVGGNLLADAGCGCGNCDCG